MCVNYDSNFHDIDKLIDDAIVSNCTESLTELYINNCHSEIMANLSKTFVNIKIVKLMYGQLGDVISTIYKNFPEIEHLTLKTVVSLDRITYHFRALTEFTVHSPTLTTESISVFISLNSQLRVLKLEQSKCLQLNASFFRFIDEKLLSLKVLGLSYPINSWMDEPNDNCERETVNLKSLKKIILNVGSGYILKKIPLQVKNLLELKIIILRNANRGLMDFLRQALVMKTLTLRIFEGNSFRIDSQFMVEFAKTLPNLRHIFLHTPDVTTNLHVVRDREVSPITDKYLKKVDSEYKLGIRPFWLL